LPIDSSSILPVQQRSCLCQISHVRSAFDALRWAECNALRRISGPLQVKSKLPDQPQQQKPLKRSAPWFLLGPDHHQRQSTMKRSRSSSSAVAWTASAFDRKPLTYTPASESLISGNETLFSIRACNPCDACRFFATPNHGIATDKTYGLIKLELQEAELPQSSAYCASVAIGQQVPQRQHRDHNAWLFLVIPK
jgi:hypothetical protein